MKKKILLLSLIFVSLFSKLAYGQEDQPRIFINGQSLDLQGQELILKDDRYFLPLRSLCQDLGYKVSWKQEDKSVLLTTENLKIHMTIASPEFFVNNLPRTMDVSPFIENDRTYVPLRFLAQALGKEVLWKGADKTIYIKDKTFQGDSSLDKYLNKDQVLKNFLEENIGSSTPRLVYASPKYSLILNYNGILLVDKDQEELKAAIDNRGLGYNQLQGDDYVKVFAKDDKFFLIQKNSQPSSGYVYSIEDNKLKYYENTGDFAFQEGESVGLEEEKTLLEKIEASHSFSYSLIKYDQGMDFLEVNTNNLPDSKIRIFDQDLNEIKTIELKELQVQD
ncbi:MAG: copper amine oxidase N-terminal domain-containing protein [Bacillota bacterium]|nr:copper amine oxidase N-terminal domain-containing protein [Bacillota bacterium]